VSANREIKTNRQGIKQMHWGLAWLKFWNCHLYVANKCATVSRETIHARSRT